MPLAPVPNACEQVRTLPEAGAAFRVMPPRVQERCLETKAGHGTDLVEVELPCLEPSLGDAVHRVIHQASKVGLLTQVAICCEGAGRALGLARSTLSRTLQMEPDRIRLCGIEGEEGAGPDLFSMFVRLLRQDGYTQVSSDLFTRPPRTI